MDSPTASGYQTFPVVFGGKNAVASMTREVFLSSSALITSYNPLLQALMSRNSGAVHLSKWSRVVCASVSCTR